LPYVLHTLALAYSASYEKQELAGYLGAPDPADRSRRGRVPTFAIDGLTRVEEKQLLEHLAFIRSQPSRATDAIEMPRGVANEGPLPTHLVRWVGRGRCPVQAPGGIQMTGMGAKQQTKPCC